MKATITALLVGLALTATVMVVYGLTMQFGLAR